MVKAKKVLIDGKPVIFKSVQNTPSINTIKNAYARIPDDKKIPVVFETKTQYLNEYIKNQEKKKHIDFTPAQEKQYKKTELRDMKNIISRYTTNHNPFIDRRVVFFTDKKIPATQFNKSVMHEYGHELWEKNPRIRKNWSRVNKSTSPTPYGRTDRQEDFAESYMLHAEGRLRDPARNRIISDTTTKNNRLNTTRTSPMGNIMANFLKPTSNSFSEFDVNHDGKINDLDMNILRKKQKQLTRDKTTKNDMSDALSVDVPEEVLFTNEWKLWGAQKEYHPGIQDYSNSAGNVAEILNRYKSKMNESGIPMGGLLAPNTNREFNLNLMLGKNKPVNPELKMSNILRRDVTSNNQEATAQEMLGDLPVYETVDYNLPVYESTATDNQNQPTKESNKKTTPSFRGFEVYDSTYKETPKLETYGSPIGNLEVYDSQVKDKIIETPKTPALTKMQKAKSEALQTILPVGQFFIDKEQKERARLNALDEKKKQNQQLKKLLLLKSQGLLGTEDTKMVDEMRAINILSNPESITAIQDYPVERTSSSKKKGKKTSYINTNPEPTFQDTAPNLWHL